MQIVFVIEAFDHEEKEWYIDSVWNFRRHATMRVAMIEFKHSHNKFGGFWSPLITPMRVKEYA